MCRKQQNQQKKKQTQVDSQVTNTSPCLKCKNRPVCSCRSLFATCWAGASSALPSLFSLIKINSLCAVNLFTVSHSWHMSADGCAELPSSAQLTSAAWAARERGRKQMNKRISLTNTSVFVCYFWHSSHRHWFWDKDTMQLCNSSFFFKSSCRVFLKKEMEIFLKCWHNPLSG